MTNLSLAPRPPLERRPASPRVPSAQELALAALGTVRGAEILVAAGEPDGLAAALARGGASVTVLTGARSPDAWRSTDLPAWGFDAVVAEGLLSSAFDPESLVYRLRAWVRPDGPFAFVEPLAPAAWDAVTGPPEGALGPRELERVRRLLPGLRIARLPSPAPRGTPAWTDVLRSAVESAASWLPALDREVRIAVLSGRLPP